MVKSTRLVKLVLSALLCAIGILIPMISPLQLVLEPASFTLGSHVAIFIAMFLSPSVAVAVSLGTALGFFLRGLPLVIVLRAITHVVFAFTGAVMLKKRPETLQSPLKTTGFSLFISLIHALAELAVVTPFYFSDSMSQAFYVKGYVVSVVLLVGLGTVVHSMVDFGLALVVWKALKVRSRAV